MAGQFMRGEPRPVTIPFTLVKSVNDGDLIATVVGTGAGYKASEETWNTDLATTRAAFVTRFAGASQQFKDANQPVRGMSGFPLQILAYAGGVRAYSCKAGTYWNGILLGPAKQAGNALEDQILEIVATQAQATHICVGGFGVNPVEIEAEPLSRVFPVAPQ